MPPSYAPLPNPRSVAEDEAADRELEGAFESDDEEAQLVHAPTSPPVVRSVSIPGAYDFERVDYDYPPPGSPPGPGHAFGNSNGVMGGEVARPHQPGQSILRRAVGALLPSHYTRVPSGDNSRRIVGSNDGVFANVAAKPSRNVEVRNEDGSVYMVPEESQTQLPPTYACAQLDAVPTYYETTVHAPAGFDPNADMIVEDLPTGSVFIFFANVFVSFFFQFVGFIMTYLMHTSHAAKYGSRVGLGLTLIQYGYYSRMNLPEDGTVDIDSSGMLMSFNETKSGWQLAAGGDGIDGFNSTMEEYQQAITASWLASRAWLSFFLMAIGWFLMLTSVLGYWRVKRWERSLRAASAPPTDGSESARRGAPLHALGTFFRIRPFHRSRIPEPRHRDEADELANIPEDQLTDDQRLRRNLMAAGFL